MWRCKHSILYKGSWYHNDHFAAHCRNNYCIVRFGALSVFSLLRIHSSGLRAGLVVLLLSRLVGFFLWVGKPRSNKTLYVKEIFPLQAAAILWNDCKPVKPHTHGEGEYSVLIDILRIQKELW